MSTGKLTTHVLDTAHGCPAANLQIDLWQVYSSSDRTHLKTVKTNADGRTESPLLLEDAFQPGIYELVFAVGDYFAGLDVPLDSPMFLDQIPLRFGIADADSHYHVPLLVSPWAYSTYRGS
ncbi:hydroxyisourate hydrolase [Romeria aff. gracilis LEGE 07310]|uniref:5-hydroxyisourate hydrolase n=1 Tax=Vasconcelosia minhoensis LEGE 07310 TaxID=915328 RepID=A0A8J7A881_9CYAN|nr:hydroxyisourate hydrolase [Romeria gracilis]MBE9077890.1 hydroxyisourate hydrolase [Romeria aff. gracilis LEGE 07310]